MGSWIGHIDEGIVFIILALWWMRNIFKTYIKNIETGDKYKSSLSYDCTIKGKRLPAEIILKILFPVGGLLGEIFVNGPGFLDDEGHFRKMNNIQHIPIYSLFVIHGITDLLSYCKFPLMKEMKYFTVSIAFTWYGTAFYYHSMPGMHKSALENNIHRLPIPLILLCGASFIWEFCQREAILPQLIRTYCVLNLGTWFTWVSFVMYDSFLGTKRWDSGDEDNVHFIVAAFGMHQCLNITIMLTSFFFMTSCNKCMKIINPTFSSYNYQKLNSFESNSSMDSKALLSTDDVNV